MSIKSIFKKFDESSISGVYAGPEQMKDLSPDALTEAVYAGPEEMMHISFREADMEDVYAGPEEMMRMSSTEADIVEVYAGPEVMNLVYAGPEELEEIRVKETFTDKVYAGPGLMRDGDQDEIFQTVYGGPPAQKQGFFSRLKDMLTSHRKPDRPYPENYADEPEVIISEEKVPDTSKKAPPKANV